MPPRCHNAGLSRDQGVPNPAPQRVPFFAPLSDLGSWEFHFLLSPDKGGGAGWARRVGKVPTLGYTGVSPKRPDLRPRTSHSPPGPGSSRAAENRSHPSTSSRVLPYSHSTRGPPLLTWAASDEKKPHEHHRGRVGAGSPGTGASSRRHRGRLGATGPARPLPSTGRVGGAERTKAERGARSSPSRFRSWSLIQVHFPTLEEF